MNWLSRFYRQVRDWLDGMHLRWALREIDPLHPAVPGIVLKLHAIETRSAA